MGPSAHVFDQHSRANRARVQWPAVSTIYPGDSGPCPRARGFDQLSRATWVWGQRHAVSTRCPRCLGPSSEILRCRQAVPATWAHVLGPEWWTSMYQGTRASARGPTVSNRCSWRLRPGSEVLPVRPAVLDTRTWGLGPAGWTRSPSLLGPIAKALRCQPDIPGDSVPGPWVHRVDQLSRDTHTCVRVACGVDQLSRSTGAWVRRPSGSTS